MTKAVQKVASIGTFGVTDALDLWGEKAASAQKKAEEQAALDRAAVSTSATSTPTLASEEVAAAREAERQRKQALAGQNSTILTGAGGLGGASGGGKTLLGQ